MDILPKKIPIGDTHAIVSKKKNKLIPLNIKDNTDYAYEVFNELEIKRAIVQLSNFEGCKFVGCNFLEAQFNDKPS